MTFFFDRNIAVRLARMLDAYDLDNTVRHQDDDTRFAASSTDIDIIEVLSQEKPRPILITADFSMSRKPNERAALARSGLTVVFLRKRFHSLPRHDQAVKLLSIWPTIVGETSHCRQPTAFDVTPAARKLNRLCFTADLARQDRTM